jgi:hypothetical protein
MRLPQELVDAIIDCIGIPYAQASENGDSHLPKYQSGEDGLKSLALVSGACNHRVRSHLFANYRVCTRDSLKRFDRCPDVLLGYACTLTIFQYDEDPAKILTVIRRFASSPLVFITLCLLHFPEELAEMFKSSFPNVRRIDVLVSSLYSSTLLNLVSTLERVDEPCLRRCEVVWATEGDSLPSLPPLHGRLIISDPHSPSPLFFR